MPNKTFFFVLLAAWLALFQFLGNAILGYVHTPSLFLWMMSAYNSPSSDDGHGNFIPFLVIDVVVASILMSLGMMMLSPVLVALPFKLMLFVLADGWNLLMGSLAASFVT